MAASGVRRLLLLRHARANTGVSETADADDHRRDLCARGQQDAASLGDDMRRRGWLPRLVLLSSALRARRTWEMLGEFDPRPDLEISDRLYLAGAEDMLAILRDVADTVDSVLLVGHNPGLHHLAAMLAAGAAGSPDLLRGWLPPCALVALEVDCSWRDLSAAASLSARVIRPGHPD